VVSRFLFGCLLCLLDLLRGLVELAQVLTRRVPLHALVTDYMMALGLVLRSLVFALGQMRLRGRLSRHGSWPLGPRMSIVGGSHAYFFGVRLRCVLQIACEGFRGCLAVSAADSTGK
jgi:hypothetical protein